MKAVNSFGSECDCKNKFVSCINLSMYQHLTLKLSHELMLKSMKHLVDLNDIRKGKEPASHELKAIRRLTPMRACKGPSASLNLRIMYIASWPVSCPSHASTQAQARWLFHVDKLPLNPRFCIISFRLL